MVDEMHAELMERAAELLPAEDLDRVEAAYQLAAKAHATQFRKSGIP